MHCHLILKTRKVGKTDKWFPSCVKLRQMKAEISMGLQKYQLQADNGTRKYQIGLKTSTNWSYKRDTIASIMLLLALSFISEKCGISRIGRAPATQGKWISIDIKKWPQLFCYRMNLNEKWSLGLKKPTLSKPSFSSSSGGSNWFIWQAAPILFVTVGNGREDKKFYI